MRMQEYTAGELTDALAEIREKGFDIGSLVTMKGEKLQFTVSGAEGQQVTVQYDGNELPVSTEYLVQEFLEKFELAKAALELVLHPGWTQKYSLCWSGDCERFQFRKAKANSTLYHL